MKTKSVKITGTLELWQSGKEITMQEPDKMQHEIVAFVGECPVTVAAIPIASSNAIDDQPRFEITNAEYVRAGRRLVACWNALEGMDTETIESLKPGAIVPLLDSRAQLLAALEMCKEWIPHIPRDKGAPWEDGRQKCYDAASDAIAAARGESGVQS